MDLTEIATLPIPWHLAPYRPIIFPTLMVLLCLGLFLHQRRRQRPLPTQSWYPPRGPAGPQLATLSTGSALPVADLALREERWADALRALAGGPTEPDDAWTRFHMGLAYQHLGASRDAEACYRATLEVASEHRDAAYNLAGLLANAGRVPEAVATYSKLLAWAPGDVDALYNLGHLYFALRLYPQAHEAWKAAKLADPEAPDVCATLHMLAQLRRMQMPAPRTI